MRRRCRPCRTTRWRKSPRWSSIGADAYSSFRWSWLAYTMFVSHFWEVLDAVEEHLPDSAKPLSKMGVKFGEAMQPKVLVFLLWQNYESLCPWGVRNSLSFTNQSFTIGFVMTSCMITHTKKNQSDWCQRKSIWLRDFVFLMGARTRSLDASQLPQSSWLG